jgi:hypothetical protein
MNHLLRRTITQQSLKLAAQFTRALEAASHIQVQLKKNDS